MALGQIWYLIWSTAFAKEQTKIWKQTSILIEYYLDDFHPFVVGEWISNSFALYPSSEPDAWTTLKGTFFAIKNTFCYYLWRQKFALQSYCTDTFLEKFWKANE